MKTEVIVPTKVKEVIESVGNITKRKSALKIFNVLKRKSRHSNKHGWFEVSSMYLHKVNGRYKTIINHFIENGILEIHQKEYMTGLFTSVKKKSYSRKNGICIRYRFKNLSDNKNYTSFTIEEIEFKDPKIDKKWYKILHNSLELLGYKTNISRDNYGSRVYHDLIRDYKEELKGRSYCTIDAITSQPRLLYLIMKEKGIVDREYFDIFESDKDFYLELVDKLNLENRKEAKNIFMYWALGNGYTKGYNINKLFPTTSRFLKNLKGSNYKDSSRYLSWKESRIFIDDLLENLPVSFGIPIHDCIIVRQRDANKIKQYCEKKYPELKFKVELL